MTLDEIKMAVRELSREQRLELFDDYCHSCGKYDREEKIKYLKGCQCWNDE